jgi:Snf7
MNEITESLSRSYCTPEGCDEDDLEAELGLLQDEFESDEIDIGQQTSFLQSPSLPSAPNIMYPNAPR